MEIVDTYVSKSPVFMFCKIKIYFNFMKDENNLNNRIFHSLGNMNDFNKSKHSHRTSGAINFKGTNQLLVRKQAAVIF